MELLIKIDNLTVDISGKRVLNGLDIDFMPGEVTALVGESGSGKTLTALSMLDLLPAHSTYSAGAVYFKGRDVRSMSPDGKRNMRGKGIGMVFQEPFTALNPVMKAGDQVAEAILAHFPIGSGQARRRVTGIFDLVELPARTYDMYPFELSGGMRQRVMIAVGLSCSPEALILDEPTTALDVTIQAQILDLVKSIQAEKGLTMVFITHDLSVVNKVADTVVVMRRGQVVECGKKEQVIHAPRHAYTRGLLECIPRIGDKRERLPEIRDRDREDLRQKAQGDGPWA